MDTTIVLEHLAQRNIKVWAEGDTLMFSPASQVDAQIRAELKAAKPALMAMLKSTPAPTAPATPIQQYLLDSAQRGFDGVSIATLRRLFGSDAVTELLTSGKHQVHGDILTLPPTPAPARTSAEIERKAIADQLLDQIDQAGGVMLTKGLTAKQMQVLNWLDTNSLVRVGMGRVWLVSCDKPAMTAQACLMQLSRWRNAGYSDASYSELGLLYGWGLISHLVKMRVLIRSGDLVQFAKVTSDSTGGMVTDYGKAIVANVHYQETDQAIDQLLAEIYERTVSAGEFDQQAGAGAVAFLEALGLITINGKRVYPATGRQ